VVEQALVQFGTAVAKVCGQPTPPGGFLENRRPSGLHLHRCDKIVPILTFLSPHPPSGCKEVKQTADGDVVSDTVWTS
jgi:hypothetical protein